ncbi:peptidylprolyl isomerase [Pelagicoccus mobilis]|uniref:peptidylprolyl isomerase n=1 Tax=Pelagicoccus mobilis TaxID=415221 RepID=A0A934VJL1_9BACT|nr:peptidylprolyl isomerase [Pelagicoccus mobilis]MBK1875736.1 peptidylprolyl isomerase [Pelagicoccus mobilis]
MRIPIAILLGCWSVAASFSQPTADGIYALFDTSEGQITTRLFYKEAPISCANFIGLAEGSIILWDANGEPIATPFYDGLTLHRAIPDFIVQGGDPLGDGYGGPGYYWPDEVRPDLNHDRPGTLSMANSGPNTNGSQFFFTLEAVPEFDGLYNVFGETIDGLETLESISQLPTTGPANTVSDPDHLLESPVAINSIQILRIGAEAEAFHYQPHLFPERFPADIELVRQPKTDPKLRVHSLPSARYQVETSEDLENWSHAGTIAGKFDEGDTHDLEITQELHNGKPAHFKRVSEIYGHLSRDASGSTLTVTTGEGEEAYTETIDFAAEQTATYSVPDLSYDADYVWYELSDGRTQVWIYLLGTDSSIPEIQYFLEWTSHNGGYVYIRDATPDYVEGESPDDWVLEGSFTFE